MELDWAKCIAERNKWVAHNFPDPDGKRTPLDAVLGVIEELGELTHAHLKKAQSIRGSDGYHDEKAKDAIADLTVYLWGVMADIGYTDPSSGHFSMVNKDHLILTLSHVVGGLAQDCLLGRVHIEWMGQGVDDTVSALRTYCRECGWDYDAIVQSTWDAVKQRDWVKYPHTGLPLKESVESS